MLHTVPESNIEGMKMDFEAKSDENETETNLLAELRRQKEEKANNPMDDLLHFNSPDKELNPLGLIK